MTLKDKEIDVVIKKIMKNKSKIKMAQRTEMGGLLWVSVVFEVLPTESYNPYIKIQIEKTKVKLLPEIYLSPHSSKVNKTIANDFLEKFGNEIVKEAEKIKKE